MKLLFDHNLSPRLVELLAAEFPGSAHVFRLGLERAPDLQVWDRAIRNDFTIVSKDSDFHQLSFLHGAPPKVIWIQRGNCSTADIEWLLRNNRDAIALFCDDSEATFLAIR